VSVVLGALEPSVVHLPDCFVGSFPFLAPECCPRSFVQDFAEPNGFILYVIRYARNSLFLLRDVILTALLDFFQGYGPASNNFGTQIEQDSGSPAFFPCQRRQRQRAGIGAASVKATGIVQEVAALLQGENGTLEKICRSD
jgi:hypothetical protein